MSVPAPERFPVMLFVLACLLLRREDDAAEAIGYFQRAARSSDADPALRYKAARKIIQLRDKPGSSFGKEVEEAWKIRREVQSLWAAEYITAGNKHFEAGDYWEALCAYDRATSEYGPSGFASYWAAIALKRMNDNPLTIARYYKDALEAGLFGVELDAKSGHYTEADIRKELKTLL
jgi:tetratricopeptide (TPR) repeat protein